MLPARFCRRHGWIILRLVQKLQMPSPHPRPVSPIQDETKRPSGSHGGIHGLIPALPHSALEHRVGIEAWKIARKPKQKPLACDRVVCSPVLPAGNHGGLDARTRKVDYWGSSAN